MLVSYVTYTHKINQMEENVIINFKVKQQRNSAAELKSQYLTNMVKKCYYDMFPNIITHGKMTLTYKSHVTNDVRIAGKRKSIYKIIKFALRSCYYRKCQTDWFLFTQKSCLN